MRNYYGGNCRLVAVVLVSAWRAIDNRPYRMMMYVIVKLLGVLPAGCGCLSIGVAGD
ncbi:hypothetical protein GH808_11270 [Acetobacterium fimetarium]|uniref:Uncharacterized protein n=1 Tax=Acetobacterium fimetarium TaxID=52691 RepID=A0ABR6WWP9_9FIRM|nr:hypothetical protein [Acetobacterium fimetarium]MBC3805011.1 hypothetical protein [Acetobacterium fimetarium]